MKQCYKCNRSLPESTFQKDKSRCDGLSNVCKECKAVRDRLREISGKRKEYYRLRDKERAKNGISKQYRSKNPEKMYAHVIANRFKIGEECELCPEDDVIREKLTRHHPDYDYLEIFVTLCHSCHYFADKARKESILTPMPSAT
jgi:hypothetical protein